MLFRSYGANGVYHYHGTATAPYMVKNFVGTVTQDSTHQLVPQPRAQPVRPAGTPLKGAVITDCSPNGTNNGYVLTYTLNNQTYKVDYSWTQAGTYTFKFIDPSNNVTTNTYHGFTPCQLVAAVSEVRVGSREVTLMPNPSRTSVTVSLGDGLAAEEVKSIEIISTSGVSMARVARGSRLALLFAQLACELLAGTEPDLAATLLARALDDGLHDAMWLQHCPMLAPLRQLPAWSPLEERMAARSAALRQVWQGAVELSPT